MMIILMEMDEERIQFIDKYRICLHENPCESGKGTGCAIHRHLDLLVRDIMATIYIFNEYSSTLCLSLSLVTCVCVVLSARSAVPQPQAL